MGSWGGETAADSLGLVPHSRRGATRQRKCKPAPERSAYPEESGSARRRHGQCGNGNANGPGEWGLEMKLCSSQSRLSPRTTPHQICLSSPACHIVHHDPHLSALGGLGAFRVDFHVYSRIVPSCGPPPGLVSKLPNFGRVSVLPTITLEHLGSALGAKLWLHRSIL
jgi:hypothetical protein